MFGLDDIVGGFINGGASRKAAAIQGDAHRDAMAAQERMYNQQRSDTASWRDAGSRAIAGMENPDFQRDFTASDFQADPGYAFRMQQGQKALERSKASRGLMNSGGTLKALTEYGQGMGAQEYQNAYNRFNSDRDRRFGRLSTISGQGLQATDMIGRAGQHYADQYGAHRVGAGEADSGGEMGLANAWKQGIGGAIKGVGEAASMMAGMPPGMMGGGGGSDFSKADGQGGGITEKEPGFWMKLSQIAQQGRK
jgi:hypothetical protein